MGCITIAVVALAVATFATWKLRAHRARVWITIVGVIAYAAWSTLVLVAIRAPIRDLQRELS